VGRKAHIGYNQEAYDAECAALARALAEATRRTTTPERVTIFTDAQVAIRRIASEETGPGQKYAIEARRHIATLRRAHPGIVIEIRWCPAHKGVPGNEKADEWAKLAAEEPNARGVEWLQNQDGSPRSMPLPRSLAHLKREISEKKWGEARQWVGGRTSKKKYKMPTNQKPDETVEQRSRYLLSSPRLLGAVHERCDRVDAGPALTATVLSFVQPLLSLQVIGDQVASCPLD